MQDDGIKGEVRAKRWKRGVEQDDLERGCAKKEEWHNLAQDEAVAQSLKITRISGTVSHHKTTARCDYTAC